MDGPFWVDLRGPHQIGPWPTVNLSTTDRGVVPVQGLPALGGNYFNFAGKSVWMRIVGGITTAATPGFLNLSLYWGNGGDANGTQLFLSGNNTLIASQTNAAFIWDICIRCQLTGSSGRLLAYGKCVFNPALVAANTIVFPLTNMVFTVCDLTANNYLSPQMRRSGSTAESMSVQDFWWVAMN